MIFNSHSDLAGSHAFLSASKYHWINYDLEKMEDVFLNSQAVQRGIELHAFAHHAIRLRQKLPRSEKTLNRYVNDAIGFGMVTEQILFYSHNCYGTADAIAFKDDTLRIHDLKTGAIPGSMNQLLIYNALFCLEYGAKPGEIKAELRIYQDDEVLACEPEIDDIAHIMSKIVVFDNRIEQLRAGS